MAREDQVRPGLAGHWDRFVGPGATTAETVGMLAFSAAGALCGAAGLDRDAAPRHQRRGDSAGPPLGTLARDTLVRARVLPEAADRARRRQRLEPQAMTGT